MARKFTALLLVGGLAASVIAAALLAPRFMDEAKRSAPDEARTRDGAAVAPFGLHLEVSPTVNPSNDSAVGRSAALSPTVQELGHPSIAAGTKYNGEVVGHSDYAHSVEGKGPDPNAVIGQPFQVSPSVETICKRFSSEERDSCAVVHRVLAEFSQEPRDVAWATNIEDRLRTLAEFDNYTVRDIECRTSLCVGEVAAISGRFPWMEDLRKDAVLEKSLLPVVATYGYESDPSTGRTTVTLMTYASEN